MIQADTRLRIQTVMRDAFPSYEQRVTRFYAMQEYHLGWRTLDFSPASEDPGKLIRPLLVLLMNQALGGNAAQALPLAAGIQLLHDFTLIHDDIEDNSDTRRGRVTLWKQWGLAQGINAGDGMFVIAHLSLHRLVDVGVDPALTLRVLRRFDEIILAVCEGQFLDLSFEGDLTIDTDDYLAMIGRKTAALVAGSAELGALVGGANDITAEDCAAFGRNLGLAFQIQDDILGIWGEAAITGKPRAADLYRRKLSLPVVHALANSSQRADLAAIYATAPDDGAVDRALNILDEAGSRDYCAALASDYHHAALSALAAVQPAVGDDAQVAYVQIHKLAASLLGRQY
jgi:geranylgeranyl diphosphate synthase type I